MNLKYELRVFISLEELLQDFKSFTPIADDALINLKERKANINGWTIRWMLASEMYLGAGFSFNRARVDMRTDYDTMRFIYSRLRSRWGRVEPMQVFEKTIFMDVEREYYQ